MREEHCRAGAREDDQLVRSEQREDGARGGNGHCGCRPQCRSRQLQHRMRDDCDDDRRDPPQDAARIRRAAVAHVDDGQRANHQRGGQNETRARGEEPGPARHPAADMDRHLGGVRSGDQVRERQQIPELGIGDPSSPPNDLVMEQRDVCGRTAERGESEAQKQRGDGSKRDHAGSCGEL
jgi:hypothetical protein